MGKLEAEGVEKLALGLVREAMVKGGFAVECIADDGRAKGSHVDANLMGTTRFNATTDTAKAFGKGGEALPMGDGAAAIGFYHGHLLTMEGRTSNEILQSTFWCGCTMDNGEVFFREAMRGKGLHKGMMGAFIFGNHHDAGGVHV
jgi:hypothetical protein